MWLSEWSRTCFSFSIDSIELTKSKTLLVFNKSEVLKEGEAKERVINVVGRTCKTKKCLFNQKSKPHLKITTFLKTSCLSFVAHHAVHVTTKRPPRSLGLRQRQAPLSRHCTVRSLRWNPICCLFTRESSQWVWLTLPSHSVWCSFRGVEKLTFLVFHAMPSASDVSRSARIRIAMCLFGAFQLQIRGGCVTTSRHSRCLISDRLRFWSHCSGVRLHVPNELNGSLQNSNFASQTAPEPGVPWAHPQT